jgi:hypothetical protein
MYANFTSGIDGYKKNTISPGTYTLELLDTEITNRNINQVFFDNLSVRHTKTVEVLYSGGLDSETVLSSCTINNIPVRAITMKLTVNGCIINTHDLYYSEKYCREHNIEQKIVELDVGSFFENGDYIRYLEPYCIIEPHVATHFWLLNQCTGFPVIGGDYRWPWHNLKILSPQRYEYSWYDIYMINNRIDGIGSMLDHSIDSHRLLISKHMELYNDNIHGGVDVKIAQLKKDVFEGLGLGTFEKRLRSYGYEVNYPVFNKDKYKVELIKRYAGYKSIIKWNNRIAESLNGIPGTNDRFI